MRLLKHILLTLFLTASLSSTLLAQCGSHKFTIRDLSQEEVDRRINRLRNQRLSGDYCFKFELVHLPRRGEEHSYLGYLYGTWTESGPLYRLYFPNITQPQSDCEPSTSNTTPTSATPNTSNPTKPTPPQSLQLLIQSGKNPAVWIAENNQVRQLTTTESINPLIKDGIITPFDLQMPFIYWEHSAYEGSGTIHGRQAYSLITYPNETEEDRYPNINSVRVIVDKNFNALMRVDILDKNEDTLRSLKVEKLKKIQDEWIIRCLDIKASNGDRNRFQVLEAAVNLNIPHEYFEPSSLLKQPFKVKMDLFQDIQDN